jgi:hypothetical protein
MKIWAFALAFILISAGLSSVAADSALDALVAAYPEFLAGHDERNLIWKDGTRMAISDGRPNKTFDQLIDDPDIKDQFAIPYPLGTDLKTPAPNEDPGRIRNEAFFLKMYGDCRKGEVSKRLKPVPWLASRHGGTVMVTTVNQVNERLEQVSKALEALPPSMTRFLVPSAGTYNCRTILNTKRLSVHAFGAAIDVNDKFADYWEWAKGKDGKIVWKNRIPSAIGEIFERYGFIWGAKWYHFDSMHFEYRPEIIALARAGWQR